MSPKMPFLYQMSAVVLTLGILSACENKQEEVTEVLRPVRSMVVTQPHMIQGLEFPGVVDAAKKAILSFRIDGKLKKLFVKEGQRVKKGQKIAQLDKADLIIELADKQANYDNAKAHFDRAQELMKDQYISRSDFDDLKTKLGIAKAGLDGANQKLKYSTLHAPFDGQIAKRFVDNFEDVNAKQEIVAIQDLSLLTIIIDVPESVMINARQNKDRIKLYAIIEKISNEKFPLTIKEFATQADEVTQTYSVSFTMPAIKGHSVLPGMSVTVGANESISADKLDKIYLPTNVVLEDSNGRYVYIVIPEDDNVARVQRQVVTTDKITKQGIEVLSGLEVGDRVVTAGMSKMTDNMRVQMTSGQAN